MRRLGLTRSLTPCTALEEELQMEELKKEFGKRSKRTKVIYRGKEKQREGQRQIERKRLQ